jgi:hypothetical protein
VCASAAPPPTTPASEARKPNWTIAKLLRSWQLFKKGGDSNSTNEAAAQLERLGIKQT